jgi:VanZ family protein
MSSDRLLLGWATAVGLLLMAPPALMPGLEAAGASGLDKAGHFVLFLVLALLAVAPARARTRHPLIVAAVASVLYGVLLEGLQAATGIRTADVADVVANGLGSSVGVLLPALWRRS